jgi:hypothetical protein
MPSHQKSLLGEGHCRLAGGQLPGCLLMEGNIAQPAAGEVVACRSIAWRDGSQPSNWERGNVSARVSKVMPLPQLTSATRAAVSSRWVT